MCAKLPAMQQVKPAYLVLDAFHHGQVESHLSVTKIMADSEYLRECQDLFELYVSDYIMLTRCKVKGHHLFYPIDQTNRRLCLTGSRRSLQNYLDPLRSCDCC